MKKAITILITLLILSFTQAQAPAIQWQKCLGGANLDSAQAVQQTTDGGYIMAGISASTDGDVTGNHGSQDAWVVKLDTAGTIQWQKSLGGSDGDSASSIQITSDGGYILAGISSSTDGDVTGNHGNADCWVVKLDATGILQWQKSLGGISNDGAQDIKTTSDGGYLVAGYTQSNNGDVSGNHGGQDAWVVKLDATGTIQWQKSMGGSVTDSASSIQITADGGCVVAGGSKSINGDVTENHGDFDFWIVKLDATGSIQWQKSLGSTADDRAQSVQITSDGGYIVAGCSYATNDGNVTGNHGGYDFWIIKLDVSGNLLWQKSFGGSNIDQARSVQTTSDGGYVVAGYSNSTNGDAAVTHGVALDYWVIKLDATGTLQWQKSMGGSFADSAYAINTTSDGGYVIVGDTPSFGGDVTGNHGAQDVWVVKLASDPLATPGFEKPVMVIYPNPVCDVLQIQTPANTAINAAKIMSVNGKVVIEQTQNCNIINVETLSQGIYILEVYSSEEKYTYKLVKE
jgi:Secretion system C-terminal sorting domain